MGWWSKHDLDHRSTFNEIRESVCRDFNGVNEHGIEYHVIKSCMRGSTLWILWQMGEHKKITQVMTHRNIADREILLKETSDLGGAPISYVKELMESHEQHGHLNKSDLEYAQYLLEDEALRKKVRKAKEVMIICDGDGLPVAAERLNETYRGRKIWKFMVDGEPRFAREDYIVAQYRKWLEQQEPKAA